MNRQQELVIQNIAENDVRYIRLWFTDVVGTLKSVAIAPAELEAAFSEGIGFDGSSIEGFSRVSESDMLVVPDENTFTMLPWSSGLSEAGTPAPSGQATARMFGDVKTPDGQPALTDSRYILRQQLDRAANAGYSFHTHPEIEFYLFERGTPVGKPPIPVDTAGYFDHVSRGLGYGFRRSVIGLLESMGIPVEFSHHEAGPGQNEIDLRYADALTTADNIMTFRTVVREVAADHNIHATFMPKPLVFAPGNGMHTHLSLFAGDINAFHSAGAQYQLSREGRQFMAGILRHSREMSIVTNQFVNSYKRLWAGGEAPSYVCWGHNNRSALVRVPMYKPGKDVSTRLEFRGMDSAVNPYLAFACLLAAGMKGIEEKYDLPEGADEDVAALTSAERRAMGITELPGSLEAAIEALEESEFMANVLGEHIFEVLLRSKRQEWTEYRNQVTEYELTTYLPLL